MTHQIIEAERLTVYCTQTARHEGRPLFEWLVQLALKMDLRGATAHQALCGFGQHRRLHHQHLLDIADELPVAVEIIDVTDRIDAFLDTAQEALRGYTFIRERVRWHQPNT